MPAVSTDLYTWSSTAGSNNPVGTDVIGSTLDDNLRAIQAGIKGALDPLSSVAGTNTITATGAPGLTAYASGQRFVFIPAATNTGATTLNITPSGGSSLGAKNIFCNGAACVGGELVINVPTHVEYDGTQFNVISVLAPRFKVGSFTYDVSTASGTTAITGVGFQPKAVIFVMAGNANASLVVMSVGLDDGNGAICVTNSTVESAGTWTLGATGSVIADAGSSTNATAHISAFGADGFTLTWVKTGSPTGTVHIGYLALR